ncbi:MAG: DUF5117 domain-containing protein, partial [Gammaproteobacteria bacterium]|nr:DUF5117 domain-containing protein [Gammaproteobacteria bacterium]
MRVSIITLLLLLVAGCGGNEPPGNAEEKPSFDDIVAKSEHFDGLFDVYRDRESGDVHLAIPKERLGQEYVHVVLTADGPVEGGHFRGFYRDNQVVSIQRHFDRIEFINENTNFYFDPESPLSRAATANISSAVLAVEDIVAENDNTVLINGDSLFLTEGLHQVKNTPDPEADPKTTFALGKLSESRNKIYEIRSYPGNTDVFVEYVYENPEPVVHAQEDVTDSRFVSIRVQHSFIAMPDNDFTPRLDDPRVGYFAARVTDLTTDSHTPYRDIIMRWNLEKKDPDAAVSEPI